MNQQTEPTYTYEELCDRIPSADNQELELMKEIIDEEQMLYPVQIYHGIYQAICTRETILNFRRRKGI